MGDLIETRKQIKKYFIRFLKENNIYQIYINNVNDENIRFYIKFSLDYVISIKYDLFDTFFWEESIQGFDFWTNIDNLWNETCKTIANKNDNIKSYFEYLDRGQYIS